MLLNPALKKILVVGQTPPPYGGQANMIKTMLKGKYSNVKLIHIRMSFSKDLDDVGSFSLHKVFHLFRVIIKIVYYRIIQNIQILYYPPAGPDKVPMFRDLAILCPTRWMFKKTVFHFHAAGISTMYDTLPWYLKIFYRWAYFNPDISIQLSDYNPDDGLLLGARQHCMIPNGIADGFIKMPSPPPKKGGLCNILFIGLIAESKGILILIDAIRIIKDRIPNFMVIVIGSFASPEFKNVVLKKIARHGLKKHFDFKGVLTGKAKRTQYINADILCFPTFFEAESFGLVAAEAMQFGLPVIASKWRGVQSLVKDGETGYLTPIQDSLSVADKLSLLMQNPLLRKKMGAKGRLRYLDKYTIEKFYEQLQKCFSQL